MITYDEKKKELIIPNGVGYDPQFQYEKGFNEGYWTGYKDAEDTQSINIKLRYALAYHPHIYLDYTDSIEVNSFVFKADAVDDPWEVPFYNTLNLHTEINSTNIPNEFSFSFNCYTTSSATGEMPTEFSIATLNGVDIDVLSVNCELISSDMTNNYRYTITVRTAVKRIELITGSSLILATIDAESLSVNEEPTEFDYGWWGGGHNPLSYIWFEPHTPVSILESMEFTIDVLNGRFPTEFQSATFDGTPIMIASQECVVDTSTPNHTLQTYTITFE